MSDAAGFALAAVLLGGLAMGYASLLRAGALACAVICIILTSLESLGLPRPIGLTYPKPHDVTVLQVVVGQPHQPIYLLTRRSTDAPVLYQIPWNAQTAKDAQKAMEQSRATHRPVKWSAGAAGAGKDGKGGPGGAGGADGKAGKGGGNSGTGGVQNAGKGAGPSGQGAYAGGASVFSLVPMPTLPPKHEEVP